MFNSSSYSSFPGCCPGVHSLQQCVRLLLAPCWHFLAFLGPHFGDPCMASAPERNETLTRPLPPLPSPTPRWHFCSIFAINVSTQAGGQVTGFAWEGLQASCSSLWPKLWVPFTATVCANFRLVWEVRLSTFGNLRLLDSEAHWISGYRLNGLFSVKLFSLLSLHSDGAVSSWNTLRVTEYSPWRPACKIYPTCVQMLQPS